MLFVALFSLGRIYAGLAAVFSLKIFAIFDGFVREQCTIPAGTVFCMQTSLTWFHSGKLPLAEVLVRSRKSGRVPLSVPALEVLLALPDGKEIIDVRVLSLKI